MSLIPEADLKVAHSSLGTGLPMDGKTAKRPSLSSMNVNEPLEKVSGVKGGMKTRNVNKAGSHKKLPPKNDPQSKDARHRPRLAANATFEIITLQQKNVDECMDDIAGGGSHEAREQWYASKNDCGNLEFNCHYQKKEALNSTFLVTSSLMEQDAGLLKPVDAVQNDPDNRGLNADWGNATFQVESELGELEGRMHAQHSLGVVYTTLTDDDKLEVLPKSNLDYYKTCYDVSTPVAKSFFPDLLSSDLCSVVSSGNEHQQPCSTKEQQKTHKRIQDCGLAEKSFASNQTALEPPNYHLSVIGNNYSIRCNDNMILDSGVRGGQSSMPSPSKAISSPSKELNITFLHTSTPKALAENASQLLSSQLQTQAHVMPKFRLDRQAKPEKSLPPCEVRFSDALLRNNSRLQFEPACPSVSSASTSRRGLEFEGRFAPGIQEDRLHIEKQNKLTKNNLSAADLLPLSSGYEKSGLEFSTIKKPCSDKMPSVPSCGEGTVLDESGEGISSSKEEFSELEFEFFENEDYRVKPKDAELSNYFQSFCNHRDWSVVDFNKENIGSFFLTDFVNVSHLCRMSYSADCVNADNQLQSKAAPSGLLQKSSSSPDKFSDLSFAQLPDFGAELFLQAGSSSNLNLETHCKESHQTHKSVTQTSLATAAGLNQLVKNLEKVDVFMPNTGLHIRNACQQSLKAAEFKRPSNINRSNNNDIDQGNNGEGVSPIPGDNICVDSDPGYINHPLFQDASSLSDALNSVEPHQMNEVKPAMITVPSDPSVSSTPGIGSIAANVAIVRPVSSTRRQLPVPQAVASAALSSGVSPPKSHLPQKIQEQTNSSLDECIMVKVEMEKQVKVEMVKQVKVSCAIQESCESRMSSAASDRNSLRMTSASSTRSSTQSPLPRRSNHISKIGVPLPNASAVSSAPSGTALPFSKQQKEKSEFERSGAVSASPVGIQYTIRRGISRQLPNANLVKQVKLKESVETKTAQPELVRTSNMPQLRRPSLCQNKEKSSDIGKLKNGTRPANFIAKATQENSGSPSSKIGRASVSVNSSASSSASSAPISQASPKRLLRPYQVMATNLAQKHGRESQVADPGSKKTIAVLKRVLPEQKPAGQNVNRAPEKNIKALAESLKPNSTFALRKSKNLESGLLTSKQVLMSVAGKESVSSRRASNASVCSSIRSDIIGESSTVVQHSQTPSNKKMKAIISETSEDTANIQYPHQPDVVSNSVLRELPIRKLHQLEMQCKDMSRRLLSSAVELKARTTGFEAMITVAKYYAEQVTLLSENICELRSQLVSTNAKCDVLTYQRNALVSEIQGLKEDHEVEVNGMRITHQMQLHALQDKMKAVIKEVEEEHSKMADTLQLNSLQLIEDLKSEHRKELDALGQRLSDAESKHKQKLTDLQRSHENKLKELKARFETVKSALVEKMDQVNAECTELRLRNQVLKEADPSASNNFGNQEAEKQVETLKQEIESLKVVVELRNQENNKLKKQNVALEAQVEEFTEAKQKILQLEQKLENTEAIVHMKSDYERDLAEKHTTLLRKYNKESKVNKRLSMNNEELMWKLNQAAVAPSSPKPVRRTHSGPPTKSAPGTPLVIRRSQPEMGSESFYSPDDCARYLEDSD